MTNLCSRINLLLCMLEAGWLRRRCYAVAGDSLAGRSWEGSFACVTSRMLLHAIVSRPYPKLEIARTIKKFPITTRAVQLMPVGAKFSDARPDMISIFETLILICC